MNPLQGSTFYDTLNRLIDGIILSFLFFLKSWELPEYSTFAYMLYFIACLVLGIFFSFSVDFIATCHIRGINKIFFKNDDKSIKRIEQEETNRINGLGSQQNHSSHISNRLADKMSEMQSCMSISSGIIKSRSITF